MSGRLEQTGRWIIIAFLPGAHDQKKFYTENLF